MCNTYNPGNCPARAIAFAAVQPLHTSLVSCGVTYVRLKHKKDVSVLLSPMLPCVHYYFCPLIYTMTERRCVVASFDIGLRKEIISSSDLPSFVSCSRFCKQVKAFAHFSLCRSAWREEEEHILKRKHVQKC